MNDFTTKAYEIKYKKIRNNYDSMRDSEKIAIDLDITLTDKDKMREYGRLGRFKKMAKNEMIILFIESNLDAFKKAGVSQNMILDLFKEIFERQPNQNEAVFNHFNGVNISRKDYDRVFSNAVAMIKNCPNYEALKRSLKY